MIRAMAAPSALCRSILSHNPISCALSGSIPAASLLRPLFGLYFSTTMGDTVELASSINTGSFTHGCPSTNQVILM